MLICDKSASTSFDPFDLAIHRDPRVLHGDATAGWDMIEARAPTRTRERSLSLEPTPCPIPA